MYYAEYSPYGCRALSDGDRLMRFETARERDEMVDYLNACDYYHVEGVCQAVNTRDAARRYNLRDFANADRCEEVHGLRTSACRPFFEIRPRWRGR